MEHKKILLIDDDVDLVLINKAHLEKAGYRVYAAYNGREGLEKMKEIHPDLVLLDVMMTSVGEGFEVARSIREDETLKSIPILMLSSVNDLHGFKLRVGPDEDWNPVNDFIDKPVDSDRLLKKVKTILNQAEEE